MEKDTDDDIIVTAEMARAGAAEFRAADRRFETDEEIVNSIYRAMIRARGLSKNRIPDPSGG